MEISIYEPVDLIITLMKTTINGMTDRIRRLRQESFDTQPSLSIERALIETEFYKENEGKYPIPILRALNFLEICKRKTIYIGEDELIVGERGPRPKAVSTFPELTCHSVEDLHVLNTRELQRYTISQEDIDTYEREVIPYWKGRTQRERIFNHVPKEWKEAYEVGMFTEFMEQRAPGHTSLDGKVYQHGMLDLKERIAHELKNLDFMNDPEATDKQEELTAMSISCDAAIIFAERHAELAEKISKYARVKLDDSDNAPGWKFSQWEMKGVPLRLEIGPKDLEKNQCVLVRRDTREKVFVSLDELETAIPAQLEALRKDLYQRALENREKRTWAATTMDEVKELAKANTGYIKTMWCGDLDCELKMKEEAGLSSRCMPFEQEHLSDVCPCCGKPAKTMVYWGIAY